MAERRMFSCKITSSDSFKMMSVAAQALYFHLGMEADDDGFVNNAMSIARSIGASKENIEEILQNRFAIRMNDNLIVIKHWRINNYLQKDRYHETAYKQYKDQLVVKENGSYTEKDKTDPNWLPTGYYLKGNCIQSVYEMDTEDRIGKDRIDNNIVLSSTNVSDNTHSPAVAEEPAKTAKNPVNYEEIAELYNRICVAFPQITKLSERRKKAIRARINGGYSVRDFETVFRKAQASDFLKGANDRNWCADFDWILNDGNMAKILDGNYDNGKAKLKGKTYAPGIVADGSDPNKYKNAKTFKELAEEEKRARLGI